MASLDSCFSVENHPLIIAQLESFHSVKMGNAPLGVRRLVELADNLKKIEGLDPLTCGRVRSVASIIFEEMKAASDNEAKLVSALCECANAKNALQIEAIFFGGLSPMIFKFMEMLKEPYLRELIEILPEMISKIHVDLFRTSDSDTEIFRLDISILDGYIKSIGLDNIPDEFDLTFFTLLAGYKCEGNTLNIPYNQIPNREFLQKIIEEKGVHAKLIAQLLYLCLLDVEMMLEHTSSRQISQQLIDVLSAGFFSCYLEKKDLIPFFHLLLDKIETAKAQGIKIEEIYLQKRFIADFSQVLTSNWLQEAASVYQLVRKIEVGCRKFLDRRTLNQLDIGIGRKGCDDHVMHFSKIMADIKEFNKLTVSYPISREKPFCLTKEEFEILPHTEFQKKFLGKKVEEKAPQKAAPAKGKAKKAKTAAQRDKPVREKAAQAAAALPVECEASEEVFEAEAIAVSTKSPFVEAMERSLEETTLFLRSVKIHPRVDAWRESPRLGLDYYRFHQDPSLHHLPEAEMVFRHRLPESFFSLALNPNYSKSERIRRENGQVHTSFKSVVIVNGKKHLLETVLNESNVLFHFYLKPIRQLSQYFEMTKDAYSEFPTLSQAHEMRSKGVEKVNIDGLTFDSDGHVLIEFEGNQYKVLYLNHSKEPV